MLFDQVVFFSEKKTRFKKMKRKMIYISSHNWQHNN